MPQTRLMLVLCAVLILALMMSAVLLTYRVMVLQACVDTTASLESFIPQSYINK